MNAVLSPIPAVLSFSVSYVHASSLWTPHIHHSEATRFLVCTLCLVPPVTKSRRLILVPGVSGAGHHDQLKAMTEHQPWRLQLARSGHVFIKFAELCNRIPVERTAYPPLFTRHPPSDWYFRNSWWIGPVPAATTLIEEDVSFANHPVPFASQPAASYAHGGRWSCKWRLCVLTLPQLKGNQ